MEELFPIYDPTEAKRKQAFAISLGLSLTLVVGGWLFFFSEQVRSLVGAIPQTLASEDVQEVVNGFQDVRSETGALFQADVAPVLKDVAQDFQANIEASAAADEILEQMTERIETQAYGQQVQE